MKVYSNGRAWILLICLWTVLTGAISDKNDAALKIVRLLERIEKQSPPNRPRNLTAKVTESELNAYIAYRLSEEKNPFVKSLNVRLLGNNHIKGNFKSDGEKLNLGAIFGPVLNFDFQGVVRTRSGAARLDMTALQLNGEPVSPQLLDLIMRAAASYYGTEISSINDWYQLPPGIKKMTVDKGVLILSY